MSIVWFLVAMGGGGICGNGAANRDYGIAIGGAMIAVAGILANFGVGA